MNKNTFILYSSTLNYVFVYILIWKSIFKDGKKNGIKVVEYRLTKTRKAARQMLMKAKTERIIYL